MSADTDHLRTIAKMYREHWGQNAVNAGYIDWAATEIERLRAALLPFAELGARLAGNNHEAAPITQCFFHSPGIDTLRARDLQAAVKALQPQN